MRNYTVHVCACIRAQLCAYMSVRMQYMSACVIQAAVVPHTARCCSITVPACRVLQHHTQPACRVLQHQHSLPACLPGAAASPRRRTTAKQQAFPAPLPPALSPPPHTHTHLSLCPGCEEVLAALEDDRQALLQQYHGCQASACPQEGGLTRAVVLCVSGRLVLRAQALGGLGGLLLGGQCNLGQV